MIERSGALTIKHLPRVSRIRLPATLHHHHHHPHQAYCWQHCAHQQHCSTSTPVSTETGDHSQVYHLDYVTSHLGQLSLLPSVGWEMSTGQRVTMLCGWKVKARERENHCTLDNTHFPSHQGKEAELARMASYIACSTLSNFVYAHIELMAYMAHSTCGLDTSHR